MASLCLARLAKVVPVTPEDLDLGWWWVLEHNSSDFTTLNISQLPLSYNKHSYICSVQVKLFRFQPVVLGTSLSRPAMTQ